MKIKSHLIILLLLVGAISCKKHRTCECTYSDSINGETSGSTTETEISSIKMSKKNSESWCNTNDQTVNYEDYDDDFNPINVTYKVECELIK